MSQLKNLAHEIEVSYKPLSMESPIISSMEKAYEFIQKLYSPKTIALREQFIVVYLNQSNRVIGTFPLSVGGITSTVVDIRIILSVALKIAAVNIILSHNHPSGNNKPSRADELLTQKCKQACEFMDIKLLDHIIITPVYGCYYSFAESGDV